MKQAKQGSMRRRQFLVNRPLQLRFVKAMVLILCVMAFLAVAAVYGAVWWTLASFDLMTEPVIISVIKSICWLIFLELLAIMPLIVWWGIRLTHRVAGPLVRIHAALTSMANGNYDLFIKLRDGDELQGLAEVINVLAASLRKR